MARRKGTTETVRLTVTEALLDLWRQALWFAGIGAAIGGITGFLMNGWTLGAIGAAAGAAVGLVVLWLVREYVLP
jgi:hypothetical protein